MAVEDVGDLGEQGDARGERDGVAAKVAGAARSVPILVEVIDAVDDAVGKAQRAGNVGAARAARDDQVLRDAVAVLEDVADGGGAAVERRLGRGARGNEVDRRGKARADGLIALLEGAIVGLVKFADPRGIARAAEVLEQQREIKVVAVAGGEADLEPDMAADPAGCLLYTSPSPRD